MATPVQALDIIVEELISIERELLTEANKASNDPITRAKDQSFASRLDVVVDELKGGNNAKH